VIDFIEPLRHLPRLLRLARLEREFQQPRVDLFIGIDSPSFSSVWPASHRCGATTVST
jgi:lipid A disaccharide synthetase